MGADPQPPSSGLRKSFAAGPLYCSTVTAALITREAPRVSEGVVRVLELGVATPIDDGLSPPFTVTALDANHCPGAVVLVFDVPVRPGNAKATRVVHTGDFRYSPALAAHPVLAAGPSIDLLLLDTTYAAGPRHDHPSQAVAIGATVDALRREAAAAAAAGDPPPCIVIGSYRIGKERLYLGVAAALGWKLWLPPEKRRLLPLLGLGGSAEAHLASTPSAARIFVAPMGAALSGPALAARLEGAPRGRVVGVRPTGWAWRGGRGGALRPYSPAPRVVVYGVPYSEHSSFAELRACVAALKPARLIPTVTGGRSGSPAAVAARFADLLDVTLDRGRLDFFFGKKKEDKVEEEEKPAGPPPPPSPPADSWGPALDDDWAVDEAASAEPAPSAAAAAAAVVSSSAPLAAAPLFDLASVDADAQRAILAELQPSRPGAAKRQLTLAQAVAGAAAKRGRGWR